ncbi:MAG: PEP-CTERM sorting domain-containing protein [Planctomycetota bacterium]
MIRTTVYGVSMLSLVAVPLTGQGQTVIGSDDFDGGGVFTTRLVSPDQSGTNGQFGSFFDRFGIMDPTPGIPNAVPFDFLDDSVSFPADQVGILQSGDRDNFFGVADLNNGNNPTGLGTVTWTFDISGYEDLSLSFDAGAIGDFEAADQFQFFAQIDGGAQVEIASTTTAEDTFYGVTLESGSFFDRAPSPFFVETEFTDLLANGSGSLSGGNTVFFHPDDDGVTNGDTTAEDGFIPVESLSGTIDERAYNVTNGFGNFDQVENDPFQDPLFLTTPADATGTQLTNEIQTFSTDIAGTGSELTLTFLVVQDGGGETFVLDDVVLEGSLIGGDGLIGDYSDDDFVGQADLDLVLANFGSTTLPAGFNAGNTTVGSFDGLIGQNELDDVLANFGNSGGAAVAAVPEPASLVLLSLGGLALATRRRA